MDDDNRSGKCERVECPDCQSGLDLCTENRFEAHLAMFIELKACCKASDCLLHACDGLQEDRIRALELEFQAPGHGRF